MNSLAFTNVKRCFQQRPCVLTASRPAHIKPVASRAVAGIPTDQAVYSSTPFNNGSTSYAVPPPTLVVGPAAFQAAVEAGVKKANMSALQTFKLSVLTGFYVGIGGLLMFSVGGNCSSLAAANPGLVKLIMGVVGLPTALMIILVAGGDLYTGNTALLTAAVLEGKATIKQLLKSWICSYVGNFIGCIAFVYLVHGTGLLMPLSSPAALAVTKTSLTFTQAFLRAILGNWMVCLAVWMANGCSTMGGKMIATLVCIPSFVAMGLEHCIANMFMVPCGIVHGANVTFGHFVTHNLIPVTLGNTFAGSVLVGAMYAFIYGKIGQPKAKAA